MSTRDHFNKDTKLPFDVKLFYIINQSSIAKDWLVFKKTLLADNTPLFSTLVGMIFFAFCYDDHRKNAAKIFSKYFPHVNFQEPTIADVLRFLLQLLWISTVQVNRIETKNTIINLDFIYSVLTFIKLSVLLPIEKLSTSAEHILNEVGTSDISHNDKFVSKVYLLFTALLAVICISVPFTISAQITFSLIFLLVAFLAYSTPGRLPRLILIAISLTISSRYLWWRYYATLNIDNSLDVFFGIILIFAETYAWIVLLLGFFQTVWPLERKPLPLPKDTAIWPSVDIFIPTYNEPLDIVRTTILAALNIDWPKNKINVFVLDDGNRPEFKLFVNEAGAKYITRDDNNYAKAGNINNALKMTRGDYIAIFDCDHIPVRSFLQITMGAFLADRKLALVQTPHHFYSPDPFERNIGNFKSVPNENSLFYGVVQDGSDLWNAAFFCGSCSVLKREPLLEVGGLATDTVTEDAHTALYLHRKGYSSAYLNVIQSAGLATESLSAHIGQRVRWARGMAQIFRIDNPLLGKGLNIGQRLCYINSMIHFLGGIPRLIFLLAPLGFLLFHSYLIYAPAIEILLYAAPILINTSITNSHIQGRHRHSFWAEIYETVLAWYVACATTVVLIHPKIGKFNVTAKGGLVENSFFDLNMSKPYLMLIILNLLAVVLAGYRYFLGPQDEQSTVILNFAWTAYNLMMLGGAISVAQEKVQLRKKHRIEVNTEIIIRKRSGHLIYATLRDFTSDGVGIYTKDNSTLEENEIIHIMISNGDKESLFPVRIINVKNNHIGAVFENLTIKQQLELTRCTYSKSDAWIHWHENFTKDKPLSSLKSILKVSFNGYLILIRMLPQFIKKPFLLLSSSISYIKTLLPKKITNNTLEYKDA